MIGIKRYDRRKASMHTSAGSRRLVGVPVANVLRNNVAEGVRFILDR